MAEFIEILSPSALKDLQTANLEVVKLVANIDKVGQNMAKISTPSGSDNATKKLAQDYQELQKQLANTQKQLERNRLAEIKLAQDREKAFDKYERNLTREQANLVKANSLYNQTQQRVNELTIAYNNLAIKQELGQNLSAKEIATLTNMQKELLKYQNALKNVDMSIGNHRREVGNYAKANSNLSFSIAQISRELPNFGQSFQIGILSLTNNIGFLQDSIRQVKEENVRLRAEGKQTTSAISQIGNAIFTFNTLLYIGIGVFSAYSKEIAVWAKNILAGGEALAMMNENQAKLNATTLEGQKNAIKDKSELKALLQIAKDKSLSDLERASAVDKIKSSYSFYFKEISKGAILEGNIGDAYERTAKALQERERANLIKSITDENKAKIMSLQAELRLSKLNDNYLAYQKKKAELQPIINQLLNENLKWEAEMVRLRKSSQGLDVTIKEKEIQGNKKLVKSTKEATEEINRFTEEWFLKQIDRNEKVRASFAVTTEQYASYSNEIAVLNMLLDKLRGKEIPDTLRKEQLEALDDGIKKMTSYEEVVKDTTKETEALKKATEDFINSFNTGFLADAGLQSLDMFFRLEENGKTVFQNLLEGADTLQEKFQVTFLAISQVAEEAFTFIDKFGQQNFENQYRRLEQEREVALMFAGDSATAREEIEAQYERRRAQIQRRQAEAEKRSAIFKAIINTAQAVVSALPNIPLSIAVGLIGAAQIATISSQQIPQFWKGTDDAPEGWAWTQEKGREIITDKQGRIKSSGSDKGAQLTYLNKGDKVYTASETEALMFNNNLNNMLLGSGIMMPKVEVSMDTERITNEIKSLAETIANKPSFTLVKDAKGEKLFMRKQAEIKEVLNARLNIQTYDV